MPVLLPCCYGAVVLLRRALFGATLDRDEGASHPRKLLSASWDGPALDVMSGFAKELAQDRVARLARRHQDLATFWRESSLVINRAVPNFQGPCWFTMDPASLLVTSHFNDYMPEIPPEWGALEYYEDDVNKLAEVAHSVSGISTLHEATGGDPTSSPRWSRHLVTARTRR